MAQKRYRTSADPRVPFWIAMDDRPATERPLYGVCGDRHDAGMQLPWQKSRDIQLDLLDQQAGTSSVPRVTSPRRRVPVPVPLPASERAATAVVSPPPESTFPSSAAVRVTDGRPLNVAISLLQEDTNNPRTEFADVDLDSLVQDIRARGILQPIVVHPADAAGRYRIHFGALRLRAARQAGLQEVPVVVRDAAPDAYAQVAENLMRHALSPIEIARFIKVRVDAGESNVTIAKRIGMNLTSVAHHLTLLELAPELDQALQSGRCTSPRTLHELTKLHEETPDAVKALVASGDEITRTRVAAMREAAAPALTTTPARRPSTSLLAQADAACTRLERVLDRVQGAGLSNADCEALRSRVRDLMTRLA